MSNPLLVFWVRCSSRRGAGHRVAPRRLIESSHQASSTIFLVMRRMRAPLITLIVIFSISVIGLTLIPGVDAEGRPARISLFESFYFMSYTATTIGFGELPYPFTAGQRLWVTFAIYLSVVGWAYAIGSLLTLLQDRSFRQALALQRFTRKVARLREPFLLIVGYGRAGELLGQGVRRPRAAARGHRRVVRPHRRPRAGLLPRRHPRPGRRRREPPPPGRRRPRPPVLRRRAGADQRRRDQPRGHHGGGAAASGPAGHRPDRLAADRRADARLRHADRGQPVRPVRRPPAARAERARVLPAAHLAGGGPGAELPQRGRAADGRPLGGVRLRPVRPRGHRRPAAGRARGDGHRAGRTATSRNRT